MADLGQATLELKTDNTDLDKGLQGAGDSVKKFGTMAKVALVALGASVGAGLKDSVQHYADLGDQIGKISARTGVAHEFISEFIHVIEQGGGSASDLETVFMKFNTFLQKDFALGTAKATDAMELMGITSSDVTKLLGKPMEEALMDMISMLRNMSDENTQAEVAMMVLGKAGRNLLPVIRSTEEAMRDTMLEARQLGIVFDRESAVAAEDLADAMDELTKSQLGVKLAIGELMAPTMTDFSRSVSGIIGKFANFIDSTGKVGENIVLATAGFAALSVVVVALSFVALPVLAVLGTLALTLVTVSVAVIAVTEALEKFSSPLDLVKNIINKTVSALIPFRNNIELFSVSYKKTTEAIESDTRKVTQAVNDQSVAFDQNKGRYKNYIEDMQSLQTQFNAFTLKTISTGLDEQNEVRTEKTIQGLNDLNTEVEKLTGKKLFEPLSATQIAGQNAGLAGVGNIQSGEAQLMADLAAGGTLQVSTGERDERGGVIFRDATSQEQRDMFSHRIGGPPPSLLGMPTFNAGAERNFVNNRSGLGNMGGEQTTFNISLNDKMIDQAVGQRFAEEGLGE